MNPRADELNAKIQDLTVEGQYCIEDIAEACGLIMGHCIRQMSDGIKEDQPKVLERNLRLAREKVGLHARKKCQCPPERPNCSNCGHPVFRHGKNGPPDYGCCSIPLCECWTG